MGYCTTHNLKIHQIDKDLSYDELESLETQINDYIRNHDDLSYAVADIEGDWKCDSCKWYDHIKDMVELSKQFPDVVFELEGDGEESGDMWKEYYKNGLYQDCPAQIIFPGYNPDLLEDIDR